MRSSTWSQTSWEQRRVLSVIWPQAVDLLAEPGIVVRIGMNQAIERVHHFPIAHDDDAHGADAAGAAVGGFEVDGDKARSHHSIVLLAFDRSYCINLCNPFGHLGDIC